MLDAFGDDAGPDGVGDAELDMAAYSDSFELVLEIACEIAEADAEEFGE